MSNFTYVSLFSGIGGFEQALNKLGGTCVLASEIDKFANKAYEVLYGEPTVGDITKVMAEDVPDHDVLVGGFPCFAAGTLITTKDGLKPIEDIRKGDEVLTHTNSFKPVIVPMVKRKKGIYNVKIQGSPINKVTEEHPYYVREVDVRKHKKPRRLFSNPKWVNAKDLTKKHYVGFSINKESVNVKGLTKEECWLLGRYISDGYIRDKKRSDGKGNHNKTIFSIRDEKLDQFKRVVEKTEYNPIYYKDGDRTYKAEITDTRLRELCTECGKGAVNKHIPGWIMNLPKNMAEHSLDGIMSGDGWSYGKDYFGFASISKSLTFQVSQLVAKVYNTPFTIYPKEPKNVIIGGREIRKEKQKTLWVLQFKKELSKWSHAVYIDGMLWMPVKEVVYDESFEGNVYNFEVEGDNSYVANNATVHNCQAFSVAGKRGGFNDIRGTLFFEMARIAKEKQPKIFLAENVKGLLSHDKGRTMDTIVTTLSDIGYRVDFEVLNSKYFGVPQNRERVFLIGIREDLLENESWDIPKGSTVVPKAKRRLAEYDDLKTFNFDWPEQGEVTTRLRDVLETEVDDKFYLSEEKTARLVEQLTDNDKEDVPNVLHNIYGGFKENKPRVFKDESPTIRTSAGGGHLPSLLEESDEPKINVVGNTSETTKHGNFNVYDENGLGRTVAARDYKDSMRVLESDEVKPEKIAGLWGNKQAGSVFDVEKISPTLKTSSGGYSEPLIEDKEVRPVLTPDRLEKRQNGRRFKEDGEESFTLTSLDRHGVAEGAAPKYHIRKLTPLECFRLQGFSDEAHQALVDEGISDTQRYKMAGNAVTVNVIDAIGRKLMPYL